MEKDNASWRLYVVYFTVILLILFSSRTFGQITAKHFNAKWNDANAAGWFMDLKECKSKGIIDIAKEPEMATKYKIAVIPTIIIFKDGEEVLRFQADLSFKMVATRKEVQEGIDELLMSDF